MTDDPTPAADAAPAMAVVAAPRRGWPWRWAATIVMALVAIVAFVLAWRADDRVHSSERELVKRQEDSARLVDEATLLARRAEENARDAAAKVAVLEARLNEVSVQRGQLEDLVQSVARSRDENLVADIESSLRAAVQQSALTGSAEPLVAALKQADERLARANQPRLEPLRRAMARDIDRVKASSVADVATLSIKLDEAVRMIDELPLLAAAEPRREHAAGAAPAAPAAGASEPSILDGAGAWASRQLGQAGRFLTDNVWAEVRSLVRITRIDQPEAMLMAPEQAFFLRENLKLRLLNARLAILARQFDAAQADLRAVHIAIDRYFDTSARRTQIAVDLLRQVGLQLRQAGTLRPDDSFAAISALAVTR